MSSPTKDDRIDENSRLLSGSESETREEPGRLRRVSTSTPSRLAEINGGADSTAIRQPVLYHSIVSPDQHDSDTQASIHRYKYYSRLAPHHQSILVMPDHVVPPAFLLLLPVDTSHKQSSIITIFSIWNTMLGTSILSMPWAIQQSGFGLGLLIIFLMSGLTLYTAYRIVKSTEGVKAVGEVLEFSDVCRHYLGRWGWIVSIIFSLATLLGAMLVYWVLMSNFLFNTVGFIHDHLTPALNHSSAIDSNLSSVISVDQKCLNFPQAWTIGPPGGNSSTTTAFPFNTSSPFMFSGSTQPGELDHQDVEGHQWFLRLWNKQYTVPFFLILLLGPLLNFKSPTFFTKFNALGTLSVIYLLVFVLVKGIEWHLPNPPDFTAHIKEVKPSFPALTGTLSLALFIHNAVLSILGNQKNPENNGRDLSIAYVLVGFTYMFVGAIFYMGFPHLKGCIEENFLDNFSSTDIMAFVARFCLLFQMITVFPLLTYIFRVQFMHNVFGSVYPSVKHVVLLNVMIVALCIVPAVLYPKIGTIIRFSGAFCGLAYIFALPCLVYMLARRAEGTLTWPVIIVHVSIILLGVANFIGQFLMT